MADEKVSVAFRATERQVGEIEQYAEANGLSRSDACRELIDRGLRADELEQLADDVQEIAIALEEMKQLIRDQDRSLWKRLFDE